MNIVIFGPPGAGKGTQSKFIVKKYNLHQLSTGELLRKEIINKTQLGLAISTKMNNGELVSDSIVSDLIEKFISNNDYKNRLIFDGYPRNKSQAKNLNILLEKYNQQIALNSDCCASKFLQKRSDDTLEIAITRYQTYEKNIEPVIDFYKESLLLKVVNGEASISEITNEIGGLIKGIKG